MSIRNTFPVCEINVFRIILVLIVLSRSLTGSAQPITGNGCKVGARRYQIAVTGEPSHNGFPLYRGYGGVQYSQWDGTDDRDPAYSCYRWIDGWGICYVKTATSCSDNSCYTSGTQGYFTGPATNCPLDDFIWLASVPLVTISCSMLRRRGGIG